MIEWHIKTPEELENLLKTDLEKGLSDDAASLRGAEKKNILFAKKPKDKMYYAKQMMIVLLPIVLLITAFAALLTGEKTVGYTLLFSAAFCIAMLFAAYSRARLLMESAEEAAESSARVLRGGEYVIIPHEALVEGDLVYLEKGDFVPADCRLV
ncbi:MAG: cation-transporting P-type ATPase, partial [Clostridia bacterium]|nr:cation-transporting P-type ATPase [Clostridia bacterium]